MIRLTNNMAVMAINGMDIRGLRKKANMSQFEMSEMFGIPKRTIGNWETGQSTPPKYVEKLLAEKLEAIISTNEGITQFQKLKEEYPEYKLFINDAYGTSFHGYVYAAYHGKLFMIANNVDNNLTDKFINFHEAVREYEKRSYLYLKTKAAIECGIFSPKTDTEYHLSCLILTFDVDISPIW